MRYARHNRMKTNNKNLTLDESEKKELESWIRSGKKQQRHVLRAKIVLACSQGLSVTTISKEQNVSRPTVGKWINRFAQQRIKGLVDAPRSGQPKKLSTEKVQEILRLTVNHVPKGGTHWSIRTMAKYANVTYWQVQQIWKEAGLKPHRIQGFKISKDPEFSEKVTDVVGLYLNPPSNAMVLSVDEKTQIQALDRTQPMIPLHAHQIEKQTYDYKRNGVTNLYAAFDIATGKVIGRVTKRHRAKEFLDFLRQIKRSTPKHLDLHIILDNASTHKTPEVKQWLEKNRRFKLHFTPTSASWLNAVENWFSSLTRRSLQRGIFTSVKELRNQIHRYIECHNAEYAKPFVWTKPPEKLIETHEYLTDKYMETN